MLIPPHKDKHLATESGVSALGTPPKLGKGEEVLGYALSVSIPTESQDADWSLIRLCLPLSFDLNSLEKSTIGQSGAIRVKGIVETSPSKGTVLIITGSNGLISGTISGNLSFVQLGSSTAFQEMWTVHLEGPLCENYALHCDLLAMDD